MNIFRHNQATYRWNRTLDTLLRRILNSSYCASLGKNNIFGKQALRWWECWSAECKWIIIEQRDDLKFLKFNRLCLFPNATTSILWQIILSFDPLENHFFLERILLPQNGRISLEKLAIEIIFYIIATIRLCCNNIEAYTLWESYHEITYVCHQIPRKSKLEIYE